MKLIHVDMRTQEVREVIEPRYEHLGGRALIDHVLLDDVPPTCDALGPHNKLIFAPGLLAGSGVATAGRLSVGAKSPLTGGAKEANAGGAAGDTLAKLGVKALIVEGQPAAGSLWLLHVTPEGISLLPADDFKGLGTYATSEKLQARFGADSIVVSIGPAGEQMLTGAGIACTGAADQRSNHAARGGLGAVMGSKGLKALVISGKGARMRKPVEPELFKTSSKHFAEVLINDPKTGVKGSSHLYGTASIVAAVNEMGSMPTRNFSTGNFGEASELTGEHMREVILARGGLVGTRCMPGCTIACRNQYVDENGQTIVATIQYETIALLGSNLGLGDLDDVGRLNYLCNDLGLDTIETGAALGVAVEAGLATFGDLASIEALLCQIYDGTVTGKMIGSGAAVTGRLLGIRRVPVALGQAMPGYDPRSLKGNGVTYATSPQGADHTAGNAFGARLQVNPLGVEGQKALSLKLQLISAMLDTTGLCLFARPPVLAEPQLMVDMINGLYGWGWTPADVDALNRDVLRAELEFNRRAGITAADYRIPEYMREEPLAPHGVVFDVPDADLDTVFETL